MRRTWRVLVVLLFAGMMITGYAFGQVPQLINYQGVLINPSTSQPVPDNSYTITFSIYDVASGGSPVWTESQSVPTKNGLYSVLLGSTIPLTPAIFSGAEKYLGIKVGSDPEMTPRKKIVSVAYAVTSSSVSGTSNIFPTDGNIGIGTKSPLTDLQMGSGANMFNIGTKLLLNYPGAATFGLELNNGNQFCLFSQNTLSGRLVIASDDDMWLCPGHSAKMVISQPGNVGIGTLNPQRQLHIEGSGPHDASIRLTNTQGPHISSWTIQANTGIQQLTFVDELFAVVRMLIDEDGNIGIGTTNPTNILTIQQNSATDPIADAWTIYSSRRWKTNIKPLDGALDKVNRLRGVSYDWQANGKHDIGLIAEEVGEVIPEVVAYEQNGKDARAIDYSRLVAVLIEAIKEQQKQIEQQQAAIDALMNNNR